MEQVLGESRDADGRGGDAVRAERVGVAEDGRVPTKAVHESEGLPQEVHL